MAVHHTYDPAKGFPRIMPSLRYDDVAGALNWLRDAFGFVEHLRWTDPDGAVLHAEMRIDGAYFELSQAVDAYPSPRTLGSVSGALIVFVDDVDAHHARAVRAGAAIVSEPDDKPWGLRQYIARDPEGHEWEFSQVIRDVTPEQWGATLTDTGD